MIFGKKIPQTVQHTLLEDIQTSQGTDQKSDVTLSGQVSQVSQSTSRVTQQQSVKLSTRNVYTCLKSNASIEMNVSTVFVTYNDTDAVLGQGVHIHTCTLRFNAAKTRSWLVSYRYTGDRCEAGTMTLTIRDVTSDTVYGDSLGSGRWQCVSDFTTFMISPGHALVLLLAAGGTHTPVSFTFTFTSIRLVPTTLFPSHKGTLRTPWGTLLKSDLDLAATSDRQLLLAGPGDHVLMVSSTVDGSQDYRCSVNVKLYTADSPNSPPVYDMCSALEDSLVHVLPVSAVYARFWKWEWNSYTMWFTFSFHQRSASPMRLASGEWNCSVPTWPEFKGHLICNLETECAGGEDEEDCPYNGRCGPHRLTVHDTCYEYVRPNSNISWYDAQGECIARGGYLASLNTAKEREAIMHVLSSRRTPVEVFMGLRYPDSTLPAMYSEIMQWADGTVDFTTTQANKLNNWCGTSPDTYNKLVHLSIPCSRPSGFYFLCEYPDPQHQHQHQHHHHHHHHQHGTTKPQPASPSIPLAITLNHTLAPSHVICRQGHVSHAFLACDVASACWAERDGNVDSNGVPSLDWCPAPLELLPSAFVCDKGGLFVPYSLVCDHRHDCPDRSDEVFCVFAPCSLPDIFPCFTTSQCVSEAEVCDGEVSCGDATDEGLCTYQINDYRNIYETAANPPPPAILRFNPAKKEGRHHWYGYVLEPITNKVKGQGHCPDTHFLCPGGGYCLPVYLRCNDVMDCPGGPDESGCSGAGCVGFYRCRGSLVCVHVQHLCDHMLQCPQHDDELLCHARCPTNCTCAGLAFTCRGLFSARDFPQTRYLVMRGTHLSPHLLANNTMLVHVSLARCALTSAHTPLFPNLRSLDLSENFIVTVSGLHLDSWPGLKMLNLSGNPLHINLFTVSPDYDHKSLTTLDLSRVKLGDLNMNTLKHFTALQTLNLSHTGLGSVRGDFEHLSRLRIVDLRKCHLFSFPRQAFKGMTSLKRLYADDYRLCCPSLLPPDFNSKRCVAPTPLISSCDHLLGGAGSRVVLSVLAAMSFVGNVVCLFAGTDRHMTSWRSNMAVLMIHLRVADLLMSAYLVTLRVTDRVYQGRYLWYDVTWRHSAGCKMAGVLSLLSSSVSCLLTTVAVLQCCLSLHLKSSTRTCSARALNVLCGLVWCVGGLMSSTPALPFTSHWRVMTESALCLPLPCLIHTVPGQTYTLGLMVVFTLILSSLSSAAQVLTYYSMTNYTVTAEDPVGTSPALCTARRLFHMGLCHCICRLLFPLVQVPAVHPVAPQWRVAVSMLCVVLGAALNPVLYVLGVVRERQRYEEKDRLMKQLKAVLAARQLQATGTRSLTNLQTVP